MDLRQLEIFCKVIDLKSFSRAGDAVYLTQPTVSEHIKTLEEYLGTRLIDRMGKEVIPTNAGKILYEYGRKMLDLRIEAKQVIEDLSGKMAGELTIGGSNIPGEYIIPNILGAFKDVYPKISILLKIGDTREIIQEVLDHRVEMGIVGAKIKDRKLQYHEFIKDELVLVVPASHPWGSVRSISPKELENEPFILRERGSGTRMAMETALHNAGIHLNGMKIIAEMGSTEAVRQGIKAGVGVSILSRRSVQDELRLGMLREMEIEGLGFSRNFHIVFHGTRTKSPLVEAFFDFLMHNTSFT